MRRIEKRVLVERGGISVSVPVTELGTVEHFIRDAQGRAQLTKHLYENDVEVPLTTIVFELPHGAFEVNAFFQGLGIEVLERTHVNDGGIGKVTVAALLVGDLSEPQRRSVAQAIERERNRITWG